MFVAGAVCVALGWAWNPFFPINKALWTSSYVLFTAGLALQFLALCYWLIDIKGYRRWAWPFEVFGVNALALFVGTGLMVKLMGLFKVQGWIFRNLFLIVGVADQCVAGLCDSVYFVVVVFDVVTLSEAHLYQGVLTGLTRFSGLHYGSCNLKICNPVYNLGRGAHVRRVPRCAVLYRH